MASANEEEVRISSPIETVSCKRVLAEQAVMEVGGG